MRMLILSSRAPASPPSLKWLVSLVKPPRGDESLKGHRKLLTSLKLAPQVKISWMMSSAGRGEGGAGV